jgi:hypothetical protein
MAITETAKERREAKEYMDKLADRREALKRNRDARIARLPQWAQTYIGNLESKLLEAEQHIALIAGDSPEDSNVFLTGNIKRDDVPLGKDLQIRFFMADGPVTEHGDFVDIRFDHRSGSGRKALLVQADQTVHVIPSASNSFKIVFGEY